MGAAQFMTTKERYDAFTSSYYPLGEPARFGERAFDLGLKAWAEFSPLGIQFPPSGYWRQMTAIDQFLNADAEIVLDWPAFIINPLL